MSPGIPCLLSPSFSPFTQVRSVGRLKRERSMSENATRQNGQLARNDSMWVEQQGARTQPQLCYIFPLFLISLLFVFFQLIFHMLWQVHNFKYYKASIFLHFYAFCLERWLICEVFSCSGWVEVFVGSSWFHQLPWIVTSDFSVSDLV